MAIKRITWRIVLSGESFVDANTEQEAKDRFDEIMEREGLPEWNAMETEVTSVSDDD